MPRHHSVIEPSDSHTHTLILLHDRSSNCEDFAFEFFESPVNDKWFLAQHFPTFTWVFSCVALRHAQTDGEELHQWFDTECVQKPYLDPEKRQIKGLK
jgi:lysophospholipase-2